MSSNYCSDFIVWGCAFTESQTFDFITTFKNTNLWIWEWWNDTSISVSNPADPSWCQILQVSHTRSQQLGLCDCDSLLLTAITVDQSLLLLSLGQHCHQDPVWLLCTTDIASFPRPSKHYSITCLQLNCCFAPSGHTSFISCIDYWFGISWWQPRHLIK